MTVTLLTHTAEPLKVMWAAARCCYSDELPSTIYFNDTSDERMLRTVRGCIVRNHSTVLRHVNFTFAIDGISRACANQLTRHGPGWAFDQQSLRYVKLDTEPDWVVPESMSLCESEVTRATASAAWRAYCNLVDVGVKPEDARNVLPLCTPTNLVATCNLAAFFHFWAVRRNDATGKAQSEIKAMADEMGTMIVAAVPWLAEFINAKA